MPNPFKDLTREQARELADERLGNAVRQAELEDDPMVETLEVMSIIEDLIDVSSLPG